MVSRIHAFVQLYSNRPPFFLLLLFFETLFFLTKKSEQKLKENCGKIETLKFFFFLIGVWLKKKREEMRSVMTETVTVLQMKCVNYKQKKDRRGKIAISVKFAFNIYDAMHHGRTGIAVHFKQFHVEYVGKLKKRLRMKKRSDEGGILQNDNLIEVGNRCAHTIF